MVQSFMSSAGAQISSAKRQFSDFLSNFIIERQDNPALANVSLGLGIAFITGVLSIIGKYFSFIHN